MVCHRWMKTVTGGALWWVCLAECVMYQDCKRLGS